MRDFLVTREVGDEEWYDVDVFFYAVWICRSAGKIGFKNREISLSYLYLAQKFFARFREQVTNALISVREEFELTIRD